MVTPVSSTKLKIANEVPFASQIFWNTRLANRTQGTIVHHQMI